MEFAGCVEILNVGEGDTKLTFDKDKPEERERACRVVKDMLRRGYALLVQVGERNGEPLYQRAKDFDPETAEYIIAGAPDDVIDIGTPAAELPGTGVPKKKRGSYRLPADKTRATAVARTAGG